MSLTPKNWDKFQHYKDRKPAWIKLHHELLDDYAFFRLPVASRALAPCLWLLASEYGDGEITAPLEEIAFRLRMSLDELCAALGPLVEAKFFIASNNVAIRSAHASELLAEPEQVAIPEKEREIEKQVKTEKDNAHSRDENFEKFWSSYPKRAAASPKKPARLKFDAAVKRGVDPEKIIAGARAYAAEQERLGNVGTQYIKTPEVWLNQDGWSAFDAEQKQGPPPGLDPIARRDWIRAQMEAESGTQDERADEGDRKILDGGDGVRQKNDDGREESGVVRGHAGDVETRGRLGTLLRDTSRVFASRA